MRRAFVTLLIAALPAAAQWRHFDDQVRATGFFGMGVATPLNPVARSLDTGWGLSGGIGITGRTFGLMFDGMFTDFGINHDTLMYVGAPRGDRKYWALTVDPVIHTNPHGPVDFYLTGGAGIYSRITQYRLSNYGGPFYGGDDLLGSYTIYKPGVNGGAGLAFSLGYRSNVKIFVEARYHHMFTYGPGNSFIPVTVGVRF